ncbi:MAG: 30S ribosome-binding factor RbfA [Elusimicrobiota bacterium]
MNQQYKRADRLGKLIQREISRIVTEEIRDPRLGFVTIAGVELTDDLSFAKVFYSVLGDKKEKELSTRILTNATKYVRRRVGEEVIMRKVPEIRFVFDETVEKASKVYEILNVIERETQAEEKCKKKKK